LLPRRAAFASLKEARPEVAYYLDAYFDINRRHSALGCCSPHQVEVNLLNHHLNSTFHND
jgi:putative transposase